MSAITAAGGHVFIAGARRRDRMARHRELAGVSLMDPVSAHRRLRGPYTAAGSLVRALVPGCVERLPRLIAAHEVEILTVAPELVDRVPATVQTLTSLASPDERTRFYSRLRTRRLAHGLTELIRDLVVATGLGGRSVLIDDLHEADPTDREFVAVLLRRMDPDLVTVMVGGPVTLPDLLVADRPTVEPGTTAPEDLVASITRHCRRVDAPPVETPGPGAGLSTSERAALYLASDCTADEPDLVAAYEETPAGERRRLHDARADELVDGGEPSHGLGAVPFHRLSGSDPLGSGAEAMEWAMDTCMLLGFYDATIELSRRGRELVPDDRVDLWWLFTRKLPTSLSALARADEAEAVCHEARARTSNPRVHIQCAYAIAMLLTRHRAAERHDHELALGFVNQAIAISALLPDRRQRVINTVFQRNGLALIEAHRGRPDEALRLVAEGIAELDRELGQDEHRLHRSVLRHNRAQVLTGLGRLDDAVADYRAVIAVDPMYPEYHFDLGNLLRRLGREEEALSEYETAMRLGPPFPEPYYNRGDIRAGLGDLRGALADFEYVIELDPDFIDAHVNRTAILLELGDVVAAESSAVAGLERDAANAHLHAALGQIHAERDEHAEAMTAYTGALKLEPDLLPALIGRAISANLLADPDAALTDLDHAVRLAPDDAVLRFNRAYVLRAKGKPAEALADLDTAALLAPDDEDVLAARESCRAALAMT